MKIGVLALQGAFIEHENILEGLGVESFEIRQKKDMETESDGIILPGGESTVMGKLLRELDLYDTIKQKIENGFPVFGTCAGLLLLAEKIENDSRSHFATMPVTAVRNAYGRQLGSFNAFEIFNGKKIPMTFIRAPYIKCVNNNQAEILSAVDDKIVAVRYKNQLVTAFHPELTSDTSVHQYFIDMIK